MYQLEKDFKKFFCCRSNPLSNHDNDDNLLEARSENECEKWHFLAWNRVRIWRTGRYTLTKNSQEYLPRQKDKITWVSLTLSFSFTLSLSFQRYTFIYISYVAVILSFFI